MSCPSFVACFVPKYWSRSEAFSVNVSQHDTWFQTFAVFWVLYAFFWVIPRHLNFIYRRFGTLFLFYLHRPVKVEQTECSETLAYKIQAPKNYPEEIIKQYDNFYVEELLAHRPTPTLEGHSLSAVRDCLFNIFTANLRIVDHSSTRHLRTRHAVVTGTYLSRGSKPPRIFNLGRRWCWVVTFTLWQLYSWRSTPSDHEKGTTIGGCYISWELKPDASVVQAAWLCPLLFGVGTWFNIHLCWTINNPHAVINTFEGLLLSFDKKR